MLRKYLPLLLSILAISATRVNAGVTPPNPEVETAAAKALLDVGIKLSKTTSREKYDNNFNDIAIALAQLGRTETALKAAQWISSGNAAKIQNEVLRLSVRRSAILGDVKRAESLIPQITNNNAKADALLTVARAHLRQNEFDAAQKVLFQVTPLVPENFRALRYTALLFAQSGNIVVSKRLFERAEKMLDQKPKDVFARELEIYLLKANLVDEWQQFHNENSKRRNSLDADVLEQLLKINQVDIAINATRQIPVEEQVASLCIIAYYIAPQYPEKAMRLLDEASSLMPQALTDGKNRFRENVAMGVKQNLDIFLASGYNRIGKKEEEQKWLEQLNKDTPLEKQALVHMQYYITPLFLWENLNDESTFPPEQLLQINDNIQPYLSALHTTQDDLYPLQKLINAQIAAEQTSQARGNIDFLEKNIRNQITSSKVDSYILGAVNVAELWKKTGSQERCDAILQSILNAPEQYLSDTRVNRISLFINRGLVDEGLQLFRSLPVEGKKPPQSAFYGLPDALAVAHPNQFPYELLKTDYPHTEASNISKFVHGLTNDLFQTPSERKFILNSNGGTGIFIP